MRGRTPHRNNAAIMQMFDDIAATAVMDLTPVHDPAEEAWEGQDA